MTQPPATVPLLDLSTLEEARPVRIDGKLYPMLAATAVGVREFSRLQAFARLLLDFGERDLSDDEALEFDTWLRGAVVMVMGFAAVLRIMGVRHFTTPLSRRRA